MNNTFSACPQVSDTVLSQYCSEKWCHHLQVGGAHSRSQDKLLPMFPFHTNNSRREESCYVWWLGWIKQVQSSVHCWSGETFCGECDHKKCVFKINTIYILWINLLKSFCPKHSAPCHIKLCMLCCSVQSVPHHFLFLEYISLFLSPWPALEQHQYIYWSLSKMASREKWSCYHSLVWSIVCDCGRIGSIFWYSEWHVVVWYHHQAVEKGIVFVSTLCTQSNNYLYEQMNSSYNYLAFY